MANSDLSADLGLGMLPPAPAVRGVEGHAPPKDGEGQSRRRPRPEDRTNDAANEAAKETADISPHELDHLA